MNVGSLFAGIGGFDLGLEQAGHDIVWQSETDRHASQVLEQHWPDIPNHGDVTKIGADNVADVDVLTGGFPCQNVSVAGRREGLDGARSGLWFEFARIIGELHPAWVVVENVPGLLSSNHGRDFALILDTLVDLGYIIDVDILDAQDFGVPQRRKRVFIVCQHVESLLKRKTHSSALTIAQCFIEMLVSILVVRNTKSLNGYSSSASARSLSVDGLTRRMKLFGLLSHNGGFRKMLLSNLDAAYPRSAPVPTNWDMPNGRQGAHMMATGIGFSTTNKTTTENGQPFSHIGGSWKTILDDICAIGKSCITSTETKKTTDSTIFSCAQVLLSIADFICQSNRCCPSYGSAASSTSIALQEYTNYARATSSSLFGDVERVHDWHHFIAEAEYISGLIGHLGDTTGAGEVLLEPESLSGNPTSSRDEGPPVAGLTANGVGTCGADDNQTQAGHLVVNARQDPVTSAIAQPLDTDGYSQAVALAVRGRDGGAQIEMASDDKAYALRAGTGGASKALVLTDRPRRLTPTECEKLQGFPAGWTEGHADIHRYRMLGNAVAVPVARWLGERLAKVACQ